MDTPTAIAVGLILVVSAGSIFLWMRHLENTNNHPESQIPLPTWPIGWANFGLFICLLIITVFISQILFSHLVRWLASPATTDAYATALPEPPELTPWLAVGSVLALQMPIILTFYSLRRIDPQSFGGKLSRISLQPLEAAVKATPYFIRYLPIIWLGSLAWTHFLNGLQKLGLAEEFPQQPLITLLSKGGDPIPVTLIMLMAITLVPFIEEVIFRGAIYRFFKGHTPMLAAQVISGALFALIHNNLMSFLPLLLIGVFLARVYEKEGSILVPIIFHAYWNGFSLLILFLVELGI